MIQITNRLCLSKKALRLIKRIHFHQLSFVNLVTKPSTSRQEIIQFLWKTKRDWVSVALHVYARIRSEGWQIGNVNIGNVEPSDLISLEAYRRGLGVNAGQKSP